MKHPDWTASASKSTAAYPPVFLRLLSVFLLFLILSGCSFFDDTYLVESDYPLPDRKESEASISRCPGLSAIYSRRTRSSPEAIACARLTRSAAILP